MTECEHNYYPIEYVEGLYEKWQCCLCGNIIERGKSLEIRMKKKEEEE